MRKVEYIIKIPLRQIALAFIMLEKYKKKWKDGEWV